MTAMLRIVLVLAAAGAAALAASFLLLGVATSGDPVGRLSPRATGSAPAKAVGPGKQKPSPAPRREQERHPDD